MGPLHLVHVDEKGQLALDEGALSHCLEQGKVGDAPICLISIVGEQHQEKSILMNCLIHQLQNQVSDAAWMGQKDQPVEGSDWQGGYQTMRKGVWIWSEPFWVQGPHGKVAVFLVDTEGSMDLHHQLETSIKLCVFSILLGSYQILNISSVLNQADQDYLEMFAHVAKEAGKTCSLHSAQNLDLLVHDYPASCDCGTEGGKKYLSHVIQELEASPNHVLTLEALKAASTRCYLMPHPGKFISCRNGMLLDMDKDFREQLRDYITSLVSSAGTHIRKDQNGQGLTGRKLAEKIRTISKCLKDKHYDFSAPLKMVKAFAEMRKELNTRTIKSAKTKYEQYLLEQHQGLDTQTMDQCLKVTLNEMKQQLETKCKDLLQDCQEQLLGEEPEKQAVLGELKKEWSRKEKDFLDASENKYKEVVVSANKASENAMKEMEQFLQEQAKVKCLQVPPSEMNEKLKAKRQKLLQACQEKLLHDESKPLAILEELEQWCIRKQEAFLKLYREKYKVLLLFYS
ncbi:RING finger protein 112-like [Alligator sinensis]|uniref:RING finger protein 112-like n=1 Tax=Alligator sinensis TaxID=38654 RepID=A0A3Q0FSJ7_ALLSI|nr:RING finger protein 112-like [Alligator sinensis]